MDYQFEAKGNKYYLIFSDGLVLEKDRQIVGDIDTNTKTPRVLTSFHRPDDRWNYYALLSDGSIEAYEVKRCACGLPREFPGMSPVDYEMYILLFQNWVKKGKLNYSPNNQFSLDEVVNQFDKNGSWLDDLVYDRFSCNQCGDELIISINTYRGGGGLERKEQSNQ